MWRWDVQPSFEIRSKSTSFPVELTSEKDLPKEQILTGLHVDIRRADQRSAGAGAEWRVVESSQGPTAPIALGMKKTPFR